MLDIDKPRKLRYGSMAIIEIEKTFKIKGLKAIGEFLEAASTEEICKILLIGLKNGDKEGTKDFTTERLIELLDEHGVDQETIENTLTLAMAGGMSKDLYEVTKSKNSQGTAAMKTNGTGITS
jgi:hypothetical protein